MHEVSENLKKFFKNNEITQKEVADKMGVSQAYIGKLLNNQKPIGKQTANKLNTLFGFNKGWLLTGEGRMFDEKNSKYIELVPNSLDDMSREYLEVPLLPVNAVGGSLSSFAEQMNTCNCEKIISPIKGVDFALTVSGDSMAPDFPSGSKIFIKRINEKSFIDWGRTYVLDTVNGVVIKNLFPALDEKGNVIPEKVICRSINKAFPDFLLDMNENTVFGVYRVLLCLSLK